MAKLVVAAQVEDLDNCTAKLRYFFPKWFLHAAEHGTLHENLWDILNAWKQEFLADVGFVESGNSVLTKMTGTAVNIDIPLLASRFTTKEKLLEGGEKPDLAGPLAACLTNYRSKEFYALQDYTYRWTAPPDANFMPLIRERLEALVGGGDTLPALTDGFAPSHGPEAASASAADETEAPAGWEDFHLACPGISSPNPVDIPRDSLDITSVFHSTWHKSFDGIRDVRKCFTLSMSEDNRLLPDAAVWMVPTKLGRRMVLQKLTRDRDRHDVVHKTSEFSKSIFEIARACLALKSDAEKDSVVVRKYELSWTSSTCAEICFIHEI